MNPRVRPHSKARAGTTDQLYADPESTAEPGHIRMSPEADAFAEYTPSTPRDITPWTLRTRDHRFVTRVTHRTVEGWPVVGHLHALGHLPTFEEPAEIRVFGPVDSEPDNIAGVIDRFGEVWPAREWGEVGSTSWTELAELSGPLVEIPAQWLTFHAFTQ